MCQRESSVLRQADVWHRKMRGAWAVLALLGHAAPAGAQPAPDVAAPPPAVPAPAPAAPAPPPVAPARPQISPPEVESHVDAIYPPSALAERKHADVVLIVTVDADGHVSKVDVAQSGGADLDEAALVAMRQWLFRPALRDGKPVASRIRVPFHFAPPAPPPDLVEPPPSAELELPPSHAVPGPPPPASAPPVTGAPEKPALPAAEAPPMDAKKSIEVTVVGRHQAPTRGASDFHVEVGELARVPRGNASEILKLAPGIMLSNEGGEGHAEQVFLRGFDTREGQDMEFSVDGVPINESGNLHGNGLADTHFILPELVLSVRVLEGPFDPRQGNYAVAGSADYELGLARRGLTAKYLGGSFGTQRMLLLWGPPTGSAHTFGAAEIYHTDGFGQNRDADRGTALGQYEGRLGEHGTYRVTGTAYATRYHSAGVIREDDYQAGKKGFYDTYDTRQGGNSSRYSLAAEVESSDGPVSLTQQLFLIRTDLRLLENFTGFLLDVQEPLQSPHGQRGDLIDLEVGETTIGARGSARFSDDLLGQKQSIELGYFARGDLADGTQQRLQAPSFIPYHTDTDLSSKLGDIGLYGDVDLHVTPWVTVRGGARADLFTFDVLDRCAVQDVSRPSPANPPGDVSCLDQQRFGVHREPNSRSSTASTAVLPRASLILGPYRNFTVSASYGLGVRSIDPIYISQDIKTPFASIKAYDLGAGFAESWRGIALVARSVFFHTHVDKDLIFSETQGRNTLANGTTRNGWVGAVRVTGPFFDESANVTLVRSTFDDTHLLVPYVPDAVLRSDSALFADLPWSYQGRAPRASLGLGVSYVGRRPLPYGERSETLFTLDANATLSWWHYELGLTATNLLDRKYRLGEYNFASTFDPNTAPNLVPMRQFSAGAPRGIFGSFAIHFGEAS
jgi:iron complex outermembrane recepter protein